MEDEVSLILHDSHVLIKSVENFSDDVVKGDSLSAKQLEKFINGLDVTTIGDRKLSLEQQKGTWTFVDKDPWNASFSATPYIIKSKNNLTFGQLLQYVGGTQNTRVSIEFSRGCAALAIRPYLPVKASVTIKNRF